jgi:hypothetical protein
MHLLSEQFLQDLEAASAKCLSPQFWTQALFLRKNPSLQAWHLSKVVHLEQPLVQGLQALGL